MVVVIIENHTDSSSNPFLCVTASPASLSGYLWDPTTGKLPEPSSVHRFIVLSSFLCSVLHPWLRSLAAISSAVQYSSKLTLSSWVCVTLWSPIRPAPHTVGTPLPLAAACSQLFNLALHRAIYQHGFLRLLAVELMHIYTFLGSASRADGSISMFLGRPTKIWSIVLEDDGLLWGRDIFGTQCDNVRQGATANRWVNCVVITSRHSALWRCAWSGRCR